MINNNAIIRRLNAGTVGVATRATNIV